MGIRRQGVSNQTSEIPNNSAQPEKPSCGTYILFVKFRHDSWLFVRVKNRTVHIHTEHRLIVYSTDRVTILDKWEGRTSKANLYSQESTV